MSLLLGLNSITLEVNFSNKIIHKKENCTPRFSHNYPKEWFRTKSSAWKFVKKWHTTCLIYYTENTRKICYIWNFQDILGWLEIFLCKLWKWEETSVLQEFAFTVTRHTVPVKWFSNIHNIQIWNKETLCY